MTKALPSFPFPVKINELLAPYTYFKIGGPAQYLSVVKTTQDLIGAVQFALGVKDLPFRVLGSGSNVLVSDAGLDGLTLINRAQGIRLIDKSKFILEADSGTYLSQVVNFSLQHSLAGLADLLGVPGTVGGAVYNNSHHLNHYLGDQVGSVILVNARGQLKQLTVSQLQFSYDSSVFQKTHDTIVSARFSLQPGEPKVLQSLAASALLHRRQTQPLDLPSSGCLFKNIDQASATRLHLPSASAGYLIDHLDLKGLKVGGAQVSAVHANFIVNAGQASAADVYQLSETVKAKVQAAYGVELQREIFLLGQFSQRL